MKKREKIYILYYLDKKKDLKWTKHLKIYEMQSVICII